MPLAAGCTWAEGVPGHRSLGPAWFRAMSAARSRTCGCVATGGIDASNAGDYLAAGAITVGVGSALEDDAQLPLLAQLITGGTPA